MSVKTGDIITCPYDDCNSSGIADHDFKRVQGYATIFICPNCKRKFSVFTTSEGESRYLLPKQEKGTSVSKKPAEKTHK